MTDNCVNCGAPQEPVCSYCRTPGLGSARFRMLVNPDMVNIDDLMASRPGGVIRITYGCHVMRPEHAVTFLHA